MIGQTISHYKILEKLGEGGMGVVYKAEDLKLDRFVALKFLPASLITSADEVVRFRQEAKAISALNHPNIATIYDLEEANGQKFLVLEYLPGGTLRSRTTSFHSVGRKLSPLEIIEYGLQIAEGLAHAHRHGIIHRDVKTENMMLTEEGKVKITDFGLAKLRGSAQLTKTGSTVGTAAYMSPEQILGENVDHRSDLFSFGIVLYELATGQLPFRGEHEAAQSYSIVNDAPVPVRSLHADLPSSFENVIYRSLEKDREKRYKSAEEILNDLRELHLEVSASAGISTRSARRKATLPWVVAASVMVLAFVAIYLFIPRTPISVDRQSIAVLPFRNMSDNKENEYFSDGMSEEIINALANIEELQVASRTSSFQFKGKEQDIRRIGQQLNVRNVLEGSVRKVGNKLRITAQLINVADGYHLWSETYEREMEDVFALQEEISRRIANALKIKLVREGAGTLVKHYTEDLEAYNLFLKGRYHWNKRTEEGFRKAIEYFEQAIERDPAYALAYAGVADCYNLLSAYGLLSPGESVPKARAAARRALELDKSLAEGHEALAHVSMLYDWRWSDVEKGFRRAIELNPSYATAYQRYAIYLTATGRLPEAIVQITRAQELDPLSLIINTDVGLILYLERQYDGAIEQYRKTLELNPDFAVARFALGLAYMEKGKYEEAIRELQTAITLSGGSTIMLATLGHAYAQAGKRIDAQKVLDDLKNASKRRYVSPYSIAAIYAGMGERDRAFEWLEKAYEDRSVWLIHLHLRVDPRLDGLRSDRRFVVLLRKMGLEK